MATLKYKDSDGNYQPIVGVNVQNQVVQTTGQSTTAVMSQKAVSDLVPAQASSSNQLADKEFVNSSITTATATYQGSYNLVSDLSLTISASHGQIETALNTAASGADKNDYCFVQIPTADATPTEIASVERYKHNGTTWSYEYAINNSGFTAAQWAAVNSSITSGLVGKLSGMTNTPYSSTLGLTKLFGMNDNGDCSNIGLSDLASLLGVGGVCPQLVGYKHDVLTSLPDCSCLVDALDQSTTFFPHQFMVGLSLVSWNNLNIKHFIGFDSSDTPWVYSTGSGWRRIALV